MKYLDLHQDLFWYSQNPDYIKGGLQSSWEMLKSKTIASFNSLNDWFEPDNFELIEKNLLSLPSDFHFVKNFSDLEGRETHPIIAHIEGLTGLNDTEEDWKMLDKWFSLGLRSVGPVWNYSNSLGGGTKDEDPQSGLTELGEKFTHYCLKKGIIVDLAHANRATFDDLSKILLKNDKPLFVSHGNAYSIYNNYRNYTDEQLKRIADSGGVIGVFFANSFISDKKDATLDDLFAHIDYIRKLIGVRHLAIGSDFGGILHGSPKNLQSVQDIDNLEVYLKEKGYSNDDIENIFYKNALRVMKQYLPA